MSKEKFIHVLMMVLPAALTVLVFLLPDKAPHWIAMASFVATALIAIANRRAIPPWVSTALTELQTALSTAGAPPGTAAKIIAAARKPQRVVPLPIMFLLAFCLACNATAQQLQQTAVDSFKLAGCIIGQIFSGVTDPGPIASICAGATPAVIVDVVNDIEAQPAGSPELDPSAVARVRLLETAKAKAVAAKAQAEKAK